MTPHYKVKKKLNELVSKYGGSLWLVESKGKDGFPDAVIFFKKDKVIFVEIKISSKDKLRPVQKLFFNTMKDFNSNLFILWGLEDLERLENAIKKILSI